MTADSGYCGEKNLLYLKENEIRSYTKLQDHEKRKTRAYKEGIGKYYNMTYSVEDSNANIQRAESRPADGMHLKIQTRSFGALK